MKPLLDGVRLHPEAERVLRDTEAAARRQPAPAIEIDLVAINRFRDALPPWRWHWFDSLSLRDQSRLAEGREYSQDVTDDADPLTSAS